MPSNEKPAGETVPAYEDTLSLEELRLEVRCVWDEQAALIMALRELPEVPCYRVLIFLSMAARWPEDNNIGKQMRQRLGSTLIPYKSECEGGAGLWSRIRSALLPTAAPVQSGEVSEALCIELNVTDEELRRIRNEAQAGGYRYIKIWAVMADKLCTALLDARAALSATPPAEPAGETWQPIATAPKDRRIDLAGTRNGMPSRFTNAMWVERTFGGQPLGEWTWDGKDIYGEFVVTHWRDITPLPTPEPSHDQ